MAARAVGGVVMVLVVLGRDVILVVVRRVVVGRVVVLVVGHQDRFSSS